MPYRFMLITVNPSFHYAQIYQNNRSIISESLGYKASTNYKSVTVVVNDERI